MRTSGPRLFWFGPSLAMVMILGGCGKSAPPPPAIAVSVSPSSSQAIDQSMKVAITATVSNDASSKGVTWTLSGPGTLSATTGAAISYVSPATSITSAEHATVTAVSVADPTKSASVQITVNPYPIMLLQNPPAGTLGAAYSQQIVLTGGTTPFAWTVFSGSVPSGWQVGGSLPNGLTLNSTTGVISGTPTAAGTWYFDVTATDAAGVLLAIPVSLQINPGAVTAGNAVPFLNQTLVPSAVAPGGAGVTLKVSGTGFVSGATVNFNGAPLVTTFLDSAHLSAVVPATNVATAKTAWITVTNPAPGGGSSNTVYFQVGASQSTVTFANAPNSPLQISQPFGLAVADFNQDGKADLAITASVKLYTMLGNGDGTFTPAPGSPIAVPSPPYNDITTPNAGPMAVGDFNHSGHQGLAIALPQSEAVLVFEGKGDGTFVTTLPPFVDAQGLTTTAIGTADFNADGNLDLAIVNSNNGRSPVVLGYGSGAFNAEGQLDQQGEALAVGDFNGDGKLDAASGLPVSLGNGDGTFKAANSSPGSPTQVLSAIGAGDFNGDGKLDLAATDQAGNNLLVMLGNGDGTFQAPITIAVGHGPNAIAEGDFNNDGKLDLAVVNSTDGSVTLLLGNGDGTFTPAAGSPFVVGTNPDAIVAADFNGDGKLDLAVANSTDGTVSILLQH